MLTQTKTEMEFRYLMDNCPMERNLFLKKGANVMCTVNLDLENGICNGSVGIVEDFIQSGVFIPIVKFSNGISRSIPIKYWQSEEYPTLALGQIPLKLAWAMTIHKSQGSTLSMGEIDIGNTVFECGQTYVALSRIQSLEGLYLCGLNPQKIKVNPKVKLFYSKIPKVEYDEEDEDEEKGESDDDKQNETLQEENYKEINLESFKHIHF
jgi:ATP-dependent DNA helicase PIF1